jgi:hypothetical protein
MSDIDAWALQARNIPIEDELARRGIQLRGKTERSGPCPICGGEDRFSINTVKQVFNCRGCDKGGDVIDLVQHLDSVDFAAACTTLVGAKPANGKMNGHGPEPHKVTAATYTYTDEAGETLLLVARLEYRFPDGSYVLKDGKRKKTFAQKRPDPNKPGAWIYDADGVRVVPYRLPELIEAIGNGHRIVVVEGEAKADLLWSWNVPATCCAGGAKKWKSEHSEFLRGADVIVVPDNDEPGCEHASLICGALQGVAASICVVELPGLEPKGDVVDWAKAGHTREELDGLVAIASEWQPDNDTQTSDTGLDEWDAGEDTDIPPPRGWLLANTFCRSFLSMLLADGAVGKTALRYAQLLAAATKRPLTGEHVFVRCRVLVVSLEDDTNELKRRLLAAMLHHGVSRDELKGWLFLSAPGRAKGKLLTIEKSGRTQIGDLATHLEATIVRRKIDVIMLDPFVKSHSIGENENSLIDEVASVLTDLAAKYDIAADTPHHTSKGAAEPGNAGRGRGASAMVDAGRLVKTLSPMSSEEARLFGIAEADRKQYIRLDNGKVNIIRAGGNPQWFQLVGVKIGNGTELYPNGDEVQTVTPWMPPNLWSDLSVATLNQILDRINEGMPDGERYTDSSAAKDRAAWRIVVELAPGKSEGQAREIIKTWVKNGVLVNEPYHSTVTRKTQNGLRLDSTKRPN